MKKTRFQSTQCPVARSLDHVGEWWSILILCDAFYGLSRFDDFRKSLGIAPNMLTRRLNGLVESGLLERRIYSEKPLRHDYLLTDRGRDFRPVLLTLMDWGNRHFAKGGASVLLADKASEQPVRLQLIDAHSGAPISRERHVVRPGPAADEALHRRLDSGRRRRAERDAQLPATSVTLP